jgi:hypothetical protein
MNGTEMKLKNLVPIRIKEQNDLKKFIKGYEDGYKDGHADKLWGREEVSKIATTSNIPGYAQGYYDGYYNLENHAEKLKEAGNAAAPYSPSVHFMGRGPGRLVWEKK